MTYSASFATIQINKTQGLGSSFVSFLQLPHALPTVHAFLPTRRQHCSDLCHSGLAGPPFDLLMHLVFCLLKGLPCSNTEGTLAHWNMWFFQIFPFSPSSLYMAENIRLHSYEKPVTKVYSYLVTSS